MELELILLHKMIGHMVAKQFHQVKFTKIIHRKFNSSDNSSSLSGWTDSLIKETEKVSKNMTLWLKFNNNSIKASCIICLNLASDNNKRSIRHLKPYQQLKWISDSKYIPSTILSRLQFDKFAWNSQTVPFAPYPVHEPACELWAHLWDLRLH